MGILKIRIFKVKPHLYICCMALVFGCVSNAVNADQNQFENINLVTIDEQVAIPSSGMYFNDQALKMGGLFGGVIGTLVVLQSDPAPVKITKMMASNNIVVEKMLRDEFIKQLQESNKLSIVNESPADGEFKLTITKYGLSSIPWHSELQPVVAAKVEMVNADGKIVWSASRSMNNHSDREIPAVLFDDYMNNIELLRAGYQKACEIVASDLVKNIPKQ